jgi:hypothetical protein
MKKEKIHLLTMIAGLLLAAVMICSHVLKCEAGNTAEGPVKTEQGEQSPDENYSFVSAPTITPPTAAQIHQNLVAHFLFEIALPQSEEPTISPDTQVKPGKLLLTLFRTIISPNAP